MKRSAVVFFSLSGNTKGASIVLSSLISADCFELKTEEPYPRSYGRLLSATKEEALSKAVRKLAVIPDITIYDRVFISSPNWWGCLSTPVRTFLENADLSGKEIALVATHGGTGKGNMEEELCTLLPNSARFLGTISIFDDGEGKLIRRFNEWIRKIELEETKHEEAYCGNDAGHTFVDAASL